MSAFPDPDQIWLGRALIVYGTVTEWQVGSCCIVAPASGLGDGGGSSSSSNGGGGIRLRTYSKHSDRCGVIMHRTTVGASNSFSVLSVVGTVEGTGLSVVVSRGLEPRVGVGVVGVCPSLPVG